jgi:signal transduction histidine kinase
MFRSLRFRLAALLVLLVLFPTLLASYLGYRALRENLTASAVDKVGLVASSRRDMVNFRLFAKQKRSREFLEAMEENCAGPLGDTPCGVRLLSSFVQAEGARDAWVELSGGGEVSYGAHAANLRLPRKFAPAQMAVFERSPTGEVTYVIQVFSWRGKSRISVRYGDEDIKSIFSAYGGLGKTGESFLVDEHGFFLTPARYASSSGHSHPIDASPMKLCLSGKNGMSLASDYRGASVIHGFYYMPEIGGGCIMAHIQQEEAFAPLAHLLLLFWRSDLLVILGAIIFALWLSRIISRFLTVPIENLLERTLAAERGDLESPVPTEGPLEIETLGRGFGRLISHLRESLLVREDFVSIASHDLKNPLAALSLQLSLIDKTAEKLSPEARSGIRQQTAFARRTLLRMQELINSILDLTNIRSGHFQIQAKPQDPALLLQEMFEIFQPQAQKKGLRLTLEKPEDALEAEFDHARLSQVLTNLLSNAIAHTPEGGSIRLRLCPERCVEPAKGDWIKFSVEDSGPGIPPDKVERIFDRFYQVRQNGLAGNGNGLGLYISREIVASHHGTIGVNSKPGEGAVFYFRIPVHQSAAQSGESPRPCA